VLDAWCRLVDLLNTPQDIPFLSGLIQREIIYRILRVREGRAFGRLQTLGDQSHRTAKAIAWVRANYAKPLRIEDLAKSLAWRLHTAPPFPDADRHESSAVSKAISVACSAGTHAHR